MHFPVRAVPRQDGPVNATPTPGRRPPSGFARRALQDDDYCSHVRSALDSEGLSCTVLGAHLVSQAVCDLIDQRHRRFMPDAIWGDGDPAGG